MKFTREDARTFLIGLVVALAISLAEMLITLDVETDWGFWIRSLLVAELTALGRYLLTYLGQEAFTPDDEPTSP